MYQKNHLWNSYANRIVGQWDSVPDEGTARAPVTAPCSGPTTSRHFYEDVTSEDHSSEIYQHETKNPTVMDTWSSVCVFEKKEDKITYLLDILAVLLASGPDLECR